MVYSWEKAYRERGLSGLKNNRGRPKKEMTKLNKPCCWKRKQKQGKDKDNPQVTRIIPKKQNK